MTGASASGSRLRDGRSRASGIRSRWPAGADDLGLVALDRRDRAVDAERRRLDGIARRERPGEAEAARRAPASPAPPGPRVGGRAEPAVALAPRRVRGALAVAPPGQPDLLAQRLELLARGCEVALRLRGGPLALAPRPTPCTAAISLLELRSRSAHAPASRGGLGALRLRRRRARRPRRARPPPPRRAAPGSGAARARRARARPRRRRRRARAARRSGARATSRPAERDAVERRVRVGVEAGAGVRDAVGRARPLLQLRVVGRHERQPRLLGEPREQRLRERRALDRIGAGGELVEQHERPLAAASGSRRCWRRGRRRSRGSSRSTAGRRCRRAPGRRRAGRPSRPAAAARTGGAARRARASSARPSCRPCSGR